MPEILTRDGWLILGWGNGWVKVYRGDNGRLMFTRYIYRWSERDSFQDLPKGFGFLRACAGLGALGSENDTLPSLNESMAGCNQYLGT